MKAVPAFVIGPAPVRSQWASTKVASKSKINGPCVVTGDSPAAQARPWPLPGPP